MTAYNFDDLLNGNFVPKTDLDWEFMRSASQALFKPKSPIDDDKLFAGRIDEIGDMLEAVYEEGGHAVIFGERGVGKTSLARIGALWSDLDRFSLGGLITVGYGTETTCIMKQLDPRCDEVWEIRSKDPEPQVRVFGRFAACDVFVATHAAFRSHLGSPYQSRYDGNTWPVEIGRCKFI